MPQRHDEPLESSVHSLEARLDALTDIVEHRLSAMEKLMGKLCEQMDRGMVGAFGLDKRIDRLEQKQQLLGKLVYGAWLGVIGCVTNIIVGLLRR